MKSKSYYFKIIMCSYSITYLIEVLMALYNKYFGYQYNSWLDISYKVHTQ